MDAGTAFAAERNSGCSSGLTGEASLVRTAASPGGRRAHRIAPRSLELLETHPEPLIVPTLVMSEVAYLVASRISSAAEIRSWATWRPRTSSPSRSLPRPCNPGADRAADRVAGARGPRPSGRGQQWPDRGRPGCGRAAVWAVALGDLLYLGRRASGGIVVPVVVHWLRGFSTYSITVGTDDDVVSNQASYLFLVTVGLLIVVAVGRRFINAPQTGRPS